jgi:hypothetical protein
MREMEEEKEGYQERCGEMDEELNQVKVDMQTVLDYKNDLEVLIEDQTHSITYSQNKIVGLEK